MVLKFCKRGQVPQHRRCEKSVMKTVKCRPQDKNKKNCKRSAAIAICNTVLKCQVKRS